MAASEPRVKDPILEAASNEAGGSYYLRQPLHGERSYAEGVRLSLVLHCHCRYAAMTEEKWPSGHRATLEPAPHAQRQGG